MNLILWVAASCFTGFLFLAAWCWALKEQLGQAVTYKALETNFVRRESCQLTHSATNQALTMAATASAEALHEVKISVEKLGDKVDTLLMRK